MYAFILQDMHRLSNSPYVAVVGKGTYQPSNTYYGHSQTNYSSQYGPRNRLVPSSGNHNLYQTDEIDGDAEIGEGDLTDSSIPTMLQSDADEASGDDISKCRDVKRVSPLTGTRNCWITWTSAEIRPCVASIQRSVSYNGA